MLKVFQQIADVQPEKSHPCLFKMSAVDYAAGMVRVEVAHVSDMSAHVGGLVTWPCVI